jgi:hypothetical protein
MPDLLGPDPCATCGATSPRPVCQSTCRTFLPYAAKRALLEALKAGGVKFDNHGDPEGMSYDQFDAWLGQIHGPGHLIFIPEAQP